MKITYFGHSAFLMEAEGRSVLVDPFFTGNETAAVTADTVSAGTILLTHAHNDHVGDTIEIAKRSGSMVIAPYELGNWLGTQGVEKATPANHGGTVAFEGGSTKLVPAWHSSSYTTDDGIVASGVPAGHVVRFGGKTVYFSGDTCLFSDMQLIADESLDVAVLPIGDHFTMGLADAVKAVKFLRAGIVIPCHYNTFSSIKQDPDQFKRDVEAATASRCEALRPGQSVEI
ncbi:MAG: metal-dependent hydrolase [Chloroflexia bacterium]|nr:metal-dependent hydrolase [Chloroflexia bacterium]